MTRYELDPKGNPSLEPVPTLQEVSRKRAVQTFFVGLLVDVTVVVAILWLSMADTITSLEALSAFGITFGKTIITTTAQYVLRRFIDISGYNRDGTPKEVLATSPPASPVETEGE